MIGFAFHDERLAGVGKVEVPVEPGGGPDVSGLDAPLVGQWDLDEIRFLPLLEAPGDVLKESGLIAFPGEVIVRLPFLNPILGQVALGEQGIGREGLACEIDGVEPGDGGLDLMGLRDRFSVTAEGQDAYFFGG